jgi:replicative DNA helicase
MTETFELAREQEENFIGAILKNPDRIDSCSAIVQPEDFYTQVLGWSWRAILSLRERGLGVDSVTLGDELERHGKMEDFGIGGRSGRAAISDLRSNFKGEYPESYAVKILGYAAKRRMIEEFNTGASWAVNGREAEEIRSDMMTRLSSIKVPNFKSDKHTQTFKEALSQNYDEVSNGNVSFVPTGMKDIDKMLDGGLYAPDFMIVAGRPGRGKTSLLLTVGMNAAQQGKHGAMFSLEMANTQIVMRAASMETGIPFGAMRSRKMTAGQWDKYNGFVEKFESLPLHLNDMPAITINVMRQTLVKIAALHGPVDFVLVDYIQLQGVDGEFGTRQEEVSSIARGLKGTCKEFNIPILAAAQLSRAIEQRADKKPVLSDLRESGSLEQEADIVAFLHQADEYDNSKMELIFAKHRNGAVGTVDLLFRSSQTKFEDSVTRMFRPNDKDEERAAYAQIATVGSED